ncbi:MAG: precorrin-6B methylase [Eubacteriales bacterium]|nr:precorrin-6B methylase [Eubacteriales bacterium]
MSQEKSIFSNDNILSWLHYYSNRAGLEIEKIKLVDISKKKKNLIPAIETHKRVLALVDQGHPNLFFTLWESGLGDCDLWFKTGLSPEEKTNIKICKISDMIDVEITEPAAMLIINPFARSSYKMGIRNDSFSPGSVRYVASEIRAIIINKLHLDDQDTICIISGESIAVESAIIASDGDIIAVEYKKSDRNALEENISKFGIHNISIIEDTSKESMKNLPVPSLSFIVATERFEEEVKNLLRINPEMKFVVYTLELNVLSNILEVFKKYKLNQTECIQISMSKLNSKNVFEAKPAPWILSAEIS